MCIKVGFVHPPHSTSQLDYRNIYNTLANRVLPVESQADHVSIVTLLIWGAKKLPYRPNGQLFIRYLIVADQIASHAHRLGHGSVRESDNWR